MIDWSRSMKQSFEFYTVDPNTWKNDKALQNIESCTIHRDEGVPTLGSASIKSKELLDETYFRVYLVVEQNNIVEKIPLGTYMMQTPSISFDGKQKNISMDAYTPLIELKEHFPSIGYSILKGGDIMTIASSICRENMRAPIVPTTSQHKLNTDFTANINDNWLTFVRDLIKNAKYKFVLDELGRVLFEPIQDTGSLQPVTVFNDDNSSILYSDIKDERDLYGIPNVVEVIYSTDAGMLYSKVKNSDPNSPISTVNRGREIVHRDSKPKIIGKADQAYIDEYAYQLLRNLSCLEHKITFTHGFYPITIGNAVTLNYKAAGLSNVTAKIVSQSIKCETGCSIQETAIYTTKLWR